MTLDVYNSRTAGCMELGTGLGHMTWNLAMNIGSVDVPSQISQFHAT